MIGKTLGHYQIIEKLGESGMGVVYKARDSHLDRLVAIKVLPPDKVAEPDRRRRFVQEAKAASALNHPNGQTIYYIKPGRQRHDTGPIWKVPRAGGKETPVLDREIIFWNWALMPEGLYLATQNGKKYSIEFLSFQIKPLPSTRRRLPRGESF